MGAKVVAFSSSSAKKEEALAFGADDFIATSEDPEWNERYYKDFDLILNCASSFTDLNVPAYFSAIKLGGFFNNVGAASGDELLTFHTLQFIAENINLTGAAVGSKQKAIEMLKLSSEKKICPTIEKVSLTEESLSKALKRAHKSDVRY